MPAKATATLAAVDVEVRAKMDTLERDLARAKQSVQAFDNSTGVTTRKLKEFQGAANDAAGATRQYGVQLTSSQLAALSAATATDRMVSTQKELVASTRDAEIALRRMQAANDNSTKSTRESSQSLTQTAESVKETGASFIKTALHVGTAVSAFKLLGNVALKTSPALQSLKDTGLDKWANTVVPAISATKNKIAELTPPFIATRVAAAQATEGAAKFASAMGTVRQATAQTVEFVKPFSKALEAVDLVTLAVKAPVLAAALGLVSPALRSVVTHEILAGFQALPTALGNTARATQALGAATGATSAVVNALGFIGRLAAPLAAVAAAVGVLGLAWQLAGERMAKATELLKTASESGLSVDFIQRMKLVAKEFKITTDDMVKTMENFNKVSKAKPLSFEFSEKAPDLRSEIDQRIEELRKRGLLLRNDFVELLKTATSAEDRFRILGKLLSQAADQGERMAALNLGSTFLSDESMRRLEASPTYIEDMYQKSLKVSQSKLISPEQVARAADLKRRMDDAVEVILARFIPAEKALADLGIAIKSIWVDMLEGIASLLTTITKLIEKIGPIVGVWLHNFTRMVPVLGTIYDAVRLTGNGFESWVQAITRTIPLLGGVYTVMKAIQQLGRAAEGTPTRTFLGGVDPEAAARARAQLTEQQLQPTAKLEAQRKTLEGYEAIRSFSHELENIDVLLKRLADDVRGLEPLKDTLDIREQAKAFKDLFGTELEREVRNVYETLRQYPAILEKFGGNAQTAIRTVINARAELANAMNDQNKKAADYHVMQENIALDLELTGKAYKDLAKAMADTKAQEAAATALEQVYDQMMILRKGFADTSLEALTKPKFDTASWDKEIAAIARHTAQMRADATAIDQSVKFHASLRAELQLLTVAEHNKLGATKDQITEYTRLRATGMGIDEALLVSGIKLVGELAKQFKATSDAAGDAAKDVKQFGSALDANVQLQQIALQMRAARARGPEEKAEAAARIERAKYDKLLLDDATKLEAVLKVVAAVRKQAYDQEIIQLEEAARLRKQDNEFAIATTQVEIQTIGKSISETARLTETERLRQTLQAEAAANRRKFNQEEFDARRKEIEDNANLKQFAAERRALDDALFERQTAFLTDTERQIASIQRSIHGTNWAQFMDDGLASALRFNAALKDISSTLQTNMTTAFVDVIMRTKSVSESFAAMAQSILRSLTEILVKMLIVQPIAKSLMSLLNPLMPVIGTTSVAGTVAGGVAAGRGLAFDQGNVVPFARGGLVSRPHLFPMAQGYGLMGESGPEAILPLKRAPSGRLGVSAMVGPGGGTGTEVNVYNYSSEKAETTRRTGPDGREMIEVIVGEVKKRYANGEFDSANAGRYGVRPGVARR